jgi:hypothetical protein
VRVMAAVGGLLGGLVAAADGGAIEAIDGSRRGKRQW